MEKLPLPLVCLTLSHTIDDLDAVEGYLADLTFSPLIQRCIPQILRELLVIPTPTAAQTLLYLKTLWMHSSDPHAALLGAVEYGLTPIVSYLLHVDKYDQNALNDALIFASGKGHLDIIKLLLSRGANVKVDHDRPIWIALNRGHLEAARLLRDAGADPKIFIDDHSEKVSPGIDTLKFLVESKVNVHQFILDMAYAEGKDDVVYYLNSVGISSTPAEAFVASAAGGQVAKMKELLHLHADDPTMSLDRLCPDAMDRAMQRNGIAAIRYLEGFGCPLVDSVRAQAYFYADIGDIAKLKRVTASLRYMPDTHNVVGDALVIAVRNGYTDIVEELLKYDLTHNILYLLREAVEKDNIDVVKMLLSNHQIRDISSDALVAILECAVLNVFADVINVLLTSQQLSDSLRRGNINTEKLNYVLDVGLPGIVYDTDRVRHDSLITNTDRVRHDNLITIAAIFLLAGASTDPMIKYATLDDTGDLIRTIELSSDTAMLRQFIDTRLSVYEKHPLPPRLKF